VAESGALTAGCVLIAGRARRLAGAAAQPPQDLPPVRPVQMVAPSAAASAAAAFTTAEAHAIRDDHGEHPGKVGRGAGARGTESLIRGATLPAGN
jgi:hypothetical protein